MAEVLFGMVMGVDAVRKSKVFGSKTIITALGAYLILFQWRK